MGQRRLLVILLIVATTLVDVTLAVWAIAATQGREEAQQIVFDGLAISEINLIAALVGLGAVALPSGLVCVFLAALGLAGLGHVAYAGSATPSHAFTILAILLLAQAIVTLAATLIARLAGARLLMVASPTPTSECSGPRRFQFTLGRMFEWMTSTAILVGIGRYAIDPELAADTNILRWSFVMIYPSHSVVTVIALWTVLAVRPSAWRFIFFGVATILALGVIHEVLDDGIGILVPLILPQLVWLAVALIVLRMAGYRLVRRGALADT